MPPKRKKANQLIHSPNAGPQPQKPRAKGGKAINLPAPILQPVSPMPVPATVPQLVSPVPVIVPLAACSQPIPQKPLSALKSSSSAEIFNLNASSSDESNHQTQQGKMGRQQSSSPHPLPPSLPTHPASGNAPVSPHLTKLSKMTPQITGDSDDNDDDHGSFTGSMLTASSREREKTSGVKKKVARHVALDVKHFFYKSKDGGSTC
ncbi:hypothetical protein PISMIDRAFT_13910 [Pisolithus microcarpus 441]|uniref:Uncharacterized protein n=1 Tax=Pisolithus microcarpus 441 TaxID=765257 RepID=A0A0C9YYS2_9AGAM|nr:hypothetical protein PISMIDRAFT_13910 [Pisolithus microcarpus 441]